MIAIWYRARAEIRRRRRALVVVALLGGVLAGAAMASAAGARRTWSAYPRFLEQHLLFDAVVSFGGNPDAEGYLREIAEHPMVEETTRASFFFATIESAGRRFAFPDVVLVAMDDTNGVGQIKVLEGRLPDMASADEVMVGYSFAERFDLHPGDGLRLEFRPWPGSPDVELHDVEIAAVIVLPGAFETITGRGFPNVISGTPAFEQRFRSFSFQTDDTLNVRLRGGTEAILAFGEDLVRRGIPSDGPPQPLSEFTAGVQSLNRVPVVTLWAAAALLALASIVITGQALAREASEHALDSIPLRAMGLSRRGLVAVGLMRAALVGIASMVVAVGVAVALSALTPVGIARIAEPSPGIAPDWVVLAVGGILTPLAVMAGSILPTLRATRPSPLGRARRSLAADVVARASAPVSAVSGVRMAFSSGRRGVPARQAMVGAGVSVMVVIAAFVFVASFHRVLEEPRLTGHTWDAAIVTEGPLAETEALIPRDLVDEVWQGSVFPLAEVGDLTLTAHASTGRPPSIIRGRAPSRSDELALDPVSLGRLGKAIGDRVQVRDGIEQLGGERDSEETYDMTIVGSFIVPRIVFEPAENAGQGVLFSPEGFSRVTSATFEGVYVRFASHVDPDDGVARLRDATAEVAFAVMTPLQRGMVRNMQRISAVPLFIGGVFAVIGVAALAHALSSTIRRRRRDVAVLKTLGFVSGQVRSTIRWQAITFASVALLIGVPAGIAGGRWGWLAFAEEIVVVPEPVAGAAIALILPAVLGLALAVAWFPARAAARTEPAPVLRVDR